MEGVSESTALLSEETPFFHFDIAAAVRAVETNSGQSSLESLPVKKAEVSTSVTIEIA